MRTGDAGGAFGIFGMNRNNESFNSLGECSRDRLSDMHGLYIINCIRQQRIRNGFTVLEAIAQENFVGGRNDFEVEVVDQRDGGGGQTGNVGVGQSDF